MPVNPNLANHAQACTYGFFYWIFDAGTHLCNRACAHETHANSQRTGCDFASSRFQGILYWCGWTRHYCGLFSTSSRPVSLHRMHSSQPATDAMATRFPPASFHFLRKRFLKISLPRPVWTNRLHLYQIKHPTSYRPFSLACLGAGHFAHSNSIPSSASSLLTPRRRFDER